MVGRGRGAVSWMQADPLQREILMSPNAVLSADLGRVLTEA